MKIYTKSGDKGTTALIGGKRVAKYHPRIEAYGTVDELMAFVSLLREHELDEHWKDFLLKVLDKLMVSASILAADCTDCKVQIPEISQTDIEELEHEIDTMDKQLEPLSSFILPGGHETVALCHVARTICRRAERNAVEASQDFEISENLLKYLNRLSDFFFMLSRIVAKKLNVKQISWQSKI